MSGSTHCDNDAVGDITLSVTLVSVGETVSAQTVSDSTPFDNDAVGELALSVTLMPWGGPVSDGSVSGSTPFAKNAAGDIACSVMLLALVLGSVLRTPSRLAISALSLSTLAFSVQVSLFSLKFRPSASPYARESRLVVDGQRRSARHCRSRCRIPVGTGTAATQVCMETNCAIQQEEHSRNELIFIVQKTLPSAPLHRETLVEGIGSRTYRDYMDTDIE